MATIDRLIFNALAQHRDVVLWGVGVLEVRRRKAKRISESRIIPPQNVVKFSPDEPSGVPSVVDMLVATGGADINEARALYETWLEGARTGRGVEQVVKIDGVGEIKDEKFIASPSLHSALNPEKEEVVSMGAPRKSENNYRPSPSSLPSTSSSSSYYDTPSRGGGSRSAATWMAWVLVGLLAVALGVMVCMNFGGGFSGLFGEKDAPVQPVVIVEETIINELPAVEPSPVDDTLVVDIVEPVEPEPEPVKPVVAPKPKPKPAPPRAAVYHIIAGSFAVESNADNLIAKIRREYPDLKVQKIRNSRNGLNMVSIYSSSSEHQAAGMMDNYWDIDLYLWVYKSN